MREKRPMSTTPVSGPKTRIFLAKTQPDSKKGAENADIGIRRKKTIKPKTKPLTKLDIESKSI